MSQNAIFSVKTFKYLKLAQKNTNNKDWFVKNKANYEENVKKPFEALVLTLQKELQQDLPRIPISIKSISRPLRPSNRADKGLVKSFISINLAEKKTSIFEWNPGIYINIDHKEEDHVLGLGLYLVSSRQMSLVRTKISEDFETINKILSEKKFKKAWKGIQGEKMKKPPKGFPIEQDYSDLLMHKQFYVAHKLKNSDIVKKDFAKKVAKDLKAAMPFLNWIRNTVGTYKK
jgi:uncharacterized protein (TIGR02453 family)